MVLKVAPGVVDIGVFLLSSCCVYGIFYKELKNVSCEYNRLNGSNSTLQAAWYIRRVRIFTEHAQVSGTGMHCASVAELTEVPGIVARAYRTHRSCGQV